MLDTPQQGQIACVMISIKEQRNYRNNRNPNVIFETELHFDSMELLMLMLIDVVIHASIVSVSMQAEVRLGGG